MWLLLVLLLLTVCLVLQVAKVEDNLNFRLDQMKVEVLSKKVTELSTLGNMHSEQINTLDVKIDEQIKQLKEIVSELLDNE